MLLLWALFFKGQFQLTDTLQYFEVHKIFQNQNKQKFYN